MYQNIEYNSVIPIFYFFCHLIYSYIFFKCFMCIIKAIEDKDHENKIRIYNLVSLQNIKHFNQNLKTLKYFIQT
ncbi:hypothetical protein IOLA_253 [uncultured bacterium]|nr:hypothetical protein IOLA_253 [uncultured bacterium]